MFERLVSNILDLAKVDGLILFCPNGSLLYKQLPSSFSTDILLSLGRRASTLLAASESGLMNLIDVVCKYPACTLVLRPIPGGILCLLCSENVNLAGVRLALNMGTKGLTASMLPTAEAFPEARPALVSEISPAIGQATINIPVESAEKIKAANGEKAKATPRLRVYRGVVYSD